MNKGISLAETILYFAILVILIPLIFAIFSWVAAANIRSRQLYNIDSESLKLLQTMVFNIRNSEAIIAPEFGESSSTLIIDTTKYILENNQIKISENGGPPAPLTSNKIVIADLIFINVSKFDTPGAITIKFKASNNKQQKKFYASASLRKK